MQVKFGAGLLGIFLCLLLLGCGASRSAAGTYVSEVDSDNWIELKKDGTFELYLTVVGIQLGDHGSYQVKGNTIALKFPDGTLLRGSLSDGSLVFPENSIFGFYSLTVWHKSETRR